MAKTSDHPNTEDPLRREPTSHELAVVHGLASAALEQIEGPIAAADALIWAAVVALLQQYEPLQAQLAFDAIAARQRLALAEQVR